MHMITFVNLIISCTNYDVHGLLLRFEFCPQNTSRSFSEEKPILVWKIQYAVQRGRGKPDTSDKNRLIILEQI